MTKFIQVGNTIVHQDQIRHIDIGLIDDLRITVQLIDGRMMFAQGIQAIDIVMATKPSALESKRLWWLRHQWIVHNLIGHPLMQLLAFFKKYDLAMKIHDATVPRPEGKRRE